MKTLYYSIIVVFSFAFLFIVSTTNFQARGDSGNNEALTQYPQNNTIQMSIKFEPHILYLESTQERYVKIKFFDANSDTPIKNVHFFLNVTKGDQKLMYDLFYTNNGTIKLNFEPGGPIGKWIVYGDKEPILDGWYSPTNQLNVTAPILSEEGLYHFNIELLGLGDYPNAMFPVSATKIKFNETVSVDTYPPPLKQIKSGVSVNDVKCKEGLVLVIHAHKNFPACVRPPTASKLILRGWHYYTNEQVLSKSSNSNPANDLYLKLDPDTLGPIPHRLVFFILSDSNAKIYVQYTSNEPNTGTTKSWATVYVGKANYTPINSSKLTITADPPSIPLAQNSNTTVVYTITANKDASGIYWISLAQICGVMPVVIDMESSHLGPSDIPVPSGPMHCPAQFLNVKILGIYGGIAEYKIAQPIP